MISLSKATAKKLGIKFNPHHFSGGIPCNELDVAERLYLLGFQVPDITPSPFGLSVFRRNLNAQILKYEQS